MQYSRLGYEMTFLERRELLDILYQSIEDKSRISFSRMVSNVSTFDKFAIITAADGSQAKCDFVAGADGVRSVVRDAIARETPGYQIPSTCMLCRRHRFREWKCKTDENDSQI